MKLYEELSWENVGENILSRPLPVEPSYDFYEKIGVVDTANNLMYRTSDFINMMKEIMVYNKSYIKRINQRRTDLVSNKPFVINEITDLFLKDCEESAREDIRKADMYLYILKNNTSKSPTKNLTSIKRTPVTDYLTFNGNGTTKCIWHDDSKPSLKHYPKTNTVYCWSCGKAGDVIAVVMQIYGVGFKEALSILKGE